MNEVPATGLLVRAKQAYADQTTKENQRLAQQYKDQKEVYSRWFRETMKRRFEIDATDLQFPNNETFPRHTVEGVTFGISKQYGGHKIHLVRVCPECKKETFSEDVYNLAYLGTILEKYPEGPFRHECPVAAMRRLVEQRKDERQIIPELRQITPPEENLLKALVEFIHSEGFAHLSNIQE